MSSGELAALLVAAATLVSSLAGLVVAVRTGQKTSATHELVNGASDQINVLRQALGHAEGLQEGLQRQETLLQSEPSGPLADRAPAGRAQILGLVSPARAEMDAVAAARNRPAASTARYLRQGRPE